MGKTNTKKIQIWLICIICFLFAILLAFSVTAAYFGRNRSFEGTLEFSSGIKIDYSNVEDNGDKSFTLLKLGNKATIGSFNGNNLTKLDENSSDVASSDIFYIANPEISPAQETIEYYLRIKVQFLTTVQDGATVRDREMTAREIKNVFGTENPISVNLATVESIGFIYKDGYYYLTKAGETSVNGYESLHLNTSEQIGGVYLFKSAGVNQSVNYFELKLAEIVDEYLVDNFKLSIKIEAIDARSNSGAVIDDVWNIA